MLRSFTMNRGPDAATGVTDVPLALDAVRILVLVVVLITVPLAQPRLGSGADGIGVAIALGVSTVSWVIWLLARRRPPVAIAALSVMGVAGGVLAGLSPLSTAIAVGCVVTSTVGARLNPETSLAITAGTVAAFLATALATGAPTETLLGYPLTFIGLHRDLRGREVQAEPDRLARVVNPLPARAGGPLADTGAQYGLTGLRERAALGGGTLTAGPADGEWRVGLRIPA